MLAGSFREARQPRRDRRRARRRRHGRPALERALRPPLRGAAARRGEPALGSRLRAATQALAGREAGAVAPHLGKPRSLRAVPARPRAVRARHRGGRPRGAAALPARGGEGPSLRAGPPFDRGHLHEGAATGMQAEAALKRALVLDPGNVAARCGITHLRFLDDWDWSAAEREYAELVNDPRVVAGDGFRAIALFLVGARPGDRRRLAARPGAARRSREPRVEEQPGRLPRPRRTPRRCDRAVPGRGGGRAVAGVAALRARRRPEAPR